MTCNYIIEHMEDDELNERGLPEWVELEYRHMRTMVGSMSRVHFTHLSKHCCNTLSKIFDHPGDQTQPLALAEAHCYKMGVLDLMKELDGGVTLEQVCLLDPKSEKELSPTDQFSCFLFGGILGDDPPRDRTSELRVLGFPTRHLGPVQMTTDTAVGVTKLVIEDKIPLSNIPYKEFPTIIFNRKESVEMPFRYIADGDEPKFPPGMRELLYEDLNKSFDF